MDSNEQATLRQFGGLWMAELRRNQQPHLRNNYESQATAVKNSDGIQFLLLKPEALPIGLWAIRDTSECTFNIKLRAVTSWWFMKEEHECC